MHDLGIKCDDGNILLAILTENTSIIKKLYDFGYVLYSSHTGSRSISLSDFDEDKIYEYKIYESALRLAIDMESENVIRLLHGLGYDFNSYFNQNSELNEKMSRLFYDLGYRFYDKFFYSKWKDKDRARDIQLAFDNGIGYIYDKRLCRSICKRKACLNKTEECPYGVKLDLVDCVSEETHFHSPGNNCYDTDELNRVRQHAPRSYARDATGNIIRGEDGEYVMNPVKFPDKSGPIPDGFN
jgi:hypothetical protein